MNTTALVSTAIANGTPSDIEAIVALDTEQWGSWANTPPLYRQLLDLYPSAIKVARSAEGEFIGFGVGLMNVLRREGWVLSVDVAPRARGRGTGKLLCKALIDEFERAGCRSATAIVDPQNRASRLLFESFGFLQSEMLYDYFGPGLTQLRYLKSLRSSALEAPGTW